MFLCSDKKECRCAKAHGVQRAKKKQKKKKEGSIKHVSKSNIVEVLGEFFVSAGTNEPCTANEWTVQWITSPFLLFAIETDFSRVILPLSRVFDTFSAENCVHFEELFPRWFSGSDNMISFISLGVRFDTW